MQTGNEPVLHAQGSLCGVYQQQNKVIDLAVYQNLCQEHNSNLLHHRRAKNKLKLRNNLSIVSNAEAFSLHSCHQRELKIMLILTKDII